MPTKFEPQFAIKPLQQATPGRPVIFQKRVAFVGFNPGAPQVQGQPMLSLAVHDVEHHKFVYRYFDAGVPNVLVPTSEIIFRPDLRSLTDDVNTQSASDKLFLTNDPFIVVEIPDGGQIRVLNLNTGSLVTPTQTSMDAFESWEMGVMSLGEFVPLLTVLPDTPRQSFFGAAGGAGRR